jgi:hypothetical protein|tara:strand:- start:569 stop:1018 length:450 start_codon:yes stop_codon:yes gene_type:complete
MSQGGKANKTGAQLENFVESTLTQAGYKSVTVEELREERPLTFARNVPYINLYGGNSKTEFVLCDEDGEMIRIEAKWQEVAGSVDEKYPYMYLSLLNVDEPHVIIVVDGGGQRQSSLDWLNEQAKNETRKKMDIMNMTSFLKWVNGHHD